MKNKENYKNKFFPDEKKEFKMKKFSNVESKVAKIRNK